MKRTPLLALTLTAVALLGAPWIGGVIGESVFIVATALFPALLMALGARRGRGLGALRWVFTALAAILAGCLLGMAALAGQVQEGPRLFGLPLAAALLIFGLAGLPFFLVALAYGLTFERHGVRADDLERLRGLAEATDGEN